MSKIKQLEIFEQPYLRTDLPEFAPSDRIIVHVLVDDTGSTGKNNKNNTNRLRTQAFEGDVIAKSNRGIGSSFIVRKISYGEGVERTFQLHSPAIKSIEVVRRGDVRKAKLYNLRELSGKAARIKEKIIVSDKNKSVKN